MELKGGTNNKITNVKHTGSVKCMYIGSEILWNSTVTNRSQTGWTSEIEEGIKTNKI